MIYSNINIKFYLQNKIIDINIFYHKNAYNTYIFFNNISSLNL